MLECLNPQQRLCENFRITHPIFSVKAGIFSCSKNSSSDPQAKENLPLWCCGRKRSYFAVTSFLGFANKKIIIIRLGTRRIQNYFCGSDHRKVVITGYAASCLLQGP
jgi:hypothetical protein